MNSSLGLGTGISWSEINQEGMGLGKQRTFPDSRTEQPELGKLMGAGNHIRERRNLPCTA